MRNKAVRRHHAVRFHEAGFTLLEILVVIAILGLLIGMVAPAALRQLGAAKVSIGHQSIARLGGVLDIYKLDIGTYPTTEQGLQVLVEKPADLVGWSGPYLKDSKVPLDPWNHPYVYRYPSSRTGHEYDLCSPGPDARAGSASDADKMICNQ
jgi:general secretion pathway protein G